MAENDNIKARGAALIPFLVYIVIYLGAGILMSMQGVELAFYQFPSVVAVLIAVIAGFFIFKGSIDEKFAVFAQGAGKLDIVCMLMIFLLAGGFSAVAKAMGSVDSTVNLGLSVIPVQFVTAGVFVISSFLAFATSTSMGTVGAVAPVALGLVDKAGLNMPLVMGAVLCGAMLGNNLSMISDTTISATRTQNVELKDKFRANLVIALPAFIVTVVLLVIFGAPTSVVEIGSRDFNLIKVIPYLVVIVFALVGLNVFVTLLLGIAAAGVIGIAGGDLTFLSFAQNIYTGFQSMIEVFLLSMFIGGLAEMTKVNGGIAWLLEKVSLLFKGRKSAKCGIALLAGLCDVATANDTVSIIMSGQIANDVSKQYDIDPRETASILTIAVCFMQGMLPYSAQFLTMVSLAKSVNMEVDPIAVAGHNWYLFLLLGFLLISFFIPAMGKALYKGSWNWKTNKPDHSGATEQA